MSAKEMIFTFLIIPIGVLLYLVFSTHTEMAAPKKISAALEDSIVRDMGLKSNHIVVFTSPDCGHCKQLERDLQTLDDVRIHTFLLAEPGSHNFEIAKNIWCSEDRSKAYSEWMLNDIAPKAQDCDTGALTRNLELARRWPVSVHHLPTVFIPDARERIDGANIDRIRHRLQFVPKSEKFPAR